MQSGGLIILNNPGVLQQSGGLERPSRRGGGPWGTVPELLFEKKQLIPVLQQLLISYHT